MDRLAELKGDDIDLESGENQDNINEQIANTDFFEEINQIKTHLNHIKQNIKTIEETYGRFVTSVTNDQAKKVNAELDGLITETNELTTKVRDMLQHINTHSQSDAEGRMQNNMHAMLTMKFLDLITEYQTVQRKYRDKHIEKARRQILIVYPNATEEKIQQVLENGTKEIFADQLIDTKYHKEAEDALNYVRHKHNEIKKLEASISELHQLFLDMSVLVETQGDCINHIEKHVEMATASTRTGVKQLKTANTYQKKSRNRMWCMLLIFCVIFVVILVPSVIAGVHSLRNVS